MARVYLAHDPLHGRNVAIKVLAPELAALVGPERFLREIRIEASLQHPHILPLYESGSAPGLLYYVMPYVQGETLRDRIRRETQLPLADALRITREVADALGYAHANGVVHRDIKPANILLSGYPSRPGSGESWHTLVADFGIARAVDTAGEEVLTATGLAVGTPEYMSPEQAGADRGTDHRTDVYALGCVVYEMLSGSPPFTGRTVQNVVARHRQDPVPSIRVVRDSVPEHVEAAIVRALAKVPADRFATVAEFAAALDQPTAPSRAPDTAVSPSARWRLRPRAAAYVSLLLLAAAALFAWQRLRPGAAARPAIPSWVMVADFEGPPGDRTLPAAVRELVTAVLEQSSAITPMPRQKLVDVMRDAGLADTMPLRGELARQLAVRSAVRAVLGGSVLPVGPGRYSIVLRVVDPDSGRTLVTAVRAATDDDLIPAVQSAAREVREGLGERRAAIAANAPLVQVATPSFAAYRKFIEALELTGRADVVASNRLLQEAIALDTGFASAWATIASNYITLRKPDSAAMALGEALRRPGRLDDAERYALEAQAAYVLRYDIAAGIRWYDLLLQLSPHDLSAHNNRGVYLHALGRYDEALAEFERTEALEPFGTEQSQIEIFNQVVTLLPLGRDAAAAAVARKLHGVFGEYAALLLATYQGRWEQAESVAARRARDPSTPPWYRMPSVTMAAGARAARGEVAEADRQLRAAAASADPSTRPWFCNAVLLLAAASRRSPGSPPAWLLADTASGALVAGGLWAAMAGDTMTARTRLTALRRRGAVERRRLGLGPALIEGWILAAEGRWRDVTRRLGPAATVGELDGGNLDQVSGAAVRWLVADAYTRLGERDSAAAMYARLIDPTRTPFGHLGLRGLVYPFASRALSSLRDGHRRRRRPARSLYPVQRRAQ